MSHVRWPHLLPLSLRLHAAQAILETGEVFELLTLDKDAKAVWDEFEILCTGELADAGRENRSEQDADNEGPALDAYFHRVSTELSRRMNSRAAASTEAHALLTSLTKSLSRPVCPACCRCSPSQSSSSACRWTRGSEASDATALTERGWCLKSVREVFEFTKEAASNAYDDAGIHWTPASLNLCTVVGSHNSELDLAVNAYVNEVQDNPIRARRVTLSFDSKKVVVNDYLALAYLLVHECVAHGFCGVSVEDADSGVSVPFHEGWMDCVAAYVAEDALREHQGHFGQFAGLFTQQMTSSRATRFNLRRSELPRDAQFWLAGAKAFDTLEHLFQATLARSGQYPAGGAGVARESLVALSLAVNASNLPHRDRSDFVRAINRHYCRTSTELRGLQLQKMPQVLDFIDEYLQTNNWLNLVKKVSCI